MARITGRTLSGAGERGTADVPQLPGAVQEAGGRAARRPVPERQLDLLDPIAGPERIDRHTDLQAPSSRERDQLAQGGESHRPLPRERCRQLRIAQPLDRPPRIVESETEPTAIAIRKACDRQIASAVLDR